MPKSAIYVYIDVHAIKVREIAMVSLCRSSGHPPECSWQQGLCVQSSSWTGTPYLRQSDDSTPAAVEVVMIEPALLDCIIIIFVVATSVNMTHVGTIEYRYFLKSSFISSSTIIVCSNVQINASEKIL